jgi:UMF1 family MFS transporter
MERIDTVLFGGYMANNRMNRRERSWVLYDVANSAFVMLATSVVPIYYAALAPAEARESVTVVWGFTIALATAIVALLMPFLGSLADYPKNKKKFLIGSIGTGAVACCALALAGTPFIFLAIYVLAEVALNLSMVFYDAFLVDATEEENYDSLSSKGYAWGYVGSLIPFGICLALILGGSSFGLATATATKISFFITAAWWVIFSLPVIRNVHQAHSKPWEEHIFAKTLIGLVSTIKRIIGNRKMLFFLIAFFCYIDGVHTIIKMATAYGSSLGIDSSQMIIALVVTQLVAFPSALIFGKLAGRVGTRKMLIVSVGAYTLITLFAAFFLKTATEFWILAVSVGLFQGGIQALSRSYFGKLIPDKSHSNEYFGFFDIFGKYAAILGPFFMASFQLITGNPSMGILSLTIMFIIGGVFLVIMPKGEAA